MALLKQTSSTLLLIEGKEDDIEEDDAEDEAKSEEEDLVKKKGKVIITKPTKSSIAVFTRRTSRKKLKLGEEAEDVIFKWPSPTFQEKLKDIDYGAGMENFKSLRYETRNVEERNQVEDMIISKLGKWKYSPDQLDNKFPMNWWKESSEHGNMPSKLQRIYMSRL